MKKLKATQAIILGTRTLEIGDTFEVNSGAAAGFIAAGMAVDAVEPALDKKRIKPE